MNLPTVDEIRKVLPVADLAKRTGLGRRTLYQWLAAGDVPGTGPMKEYRIKAVREELDRARAEQAPKPKRRARAAA